MPSVGGGSHGGGGSFGGGGGSFHGGHGGFHGGYYFGGGIIRSILGIIFAPFIFFLFGIAMIAAFFLTVGNGATINYDDEVFETYALDRYYELYGRGSEEEILVVFLSSPNGEEDGFYYIGVAGDYINSRISNLFMDNEPQFFKELDRVIDKNYSNSLLPALGTAISNIGDYIAANIGKDNAYVITPSTTNVGRFINKTDYIEVNGTAIATYLTGFTEKTGIPLSVYVEDMDVVFVRANNSWILLIFGLVFTGAGVAILVLGIKAYKKYKESKNKTAETEKRYDGYNNYSYNDNNNDYTGDDPFNDFK